MPADIESRSEAALDYDSGIDYHSPEPEEACSRVGAEALVTNSERASTTAKSRSNRSPAWKHFKGFYVEKKLISAQCTYCNHKP